MELELGLPLIPISHGNPLNGFNLNCNGFEPNEKTFCLGREFDRGNNCKRSFEVAFFEEVAGDHNRNVKSSLLCWHGQPNEEDDGKEDRKGTPSTIDTNEEEEEEAENHVVGWPPIKSWRRKQMHLHRQQGGRRIIKDRTVERGRRGSNSTFIQLRKEGVLPPTGRKIDPKRFHSCRTLSDTLSSMHVW